MEKKSFKKTTNHSEKVNKKAATKPRGVSALNMTLPDIDLNQSRSIQPQKVSPIRHTFHDNGLALTQAETLSRVASLSKKRVNGTLAEVSHIIEKRHEIPVHVVQDLQDQVFRKKAMKLRVDAKNPSLILGTPETNPRVEKKNLNRIDSFGSESGETYLKMMSDYATDVYWEADSSLSPAHEIIKLNTRTLSVSPNH